MLRRFSRMLRRAVSGAGAAVADSTAAPAAPPPTFFDDARAVGLTPDAWCIRRLGRRALYTTIPSELIAALGSRHPRRVNATVDAADRLLRHEFNLLGSGVFRPVDSDRPARNHYVPIDWYLDPVRALRFPRGIAHKTWNLQEMRPGNADVKYPWELGRCQHWPVLGQAYQLTRDDRYAAEIARQLEDFVEANPTGIGVNWTCTMDVGLRAVNWAIGLELVHDSPALDARFWHCAYEALFDHGVFIRNNLENTYEVTSNHFLSNLLGLQFVGASFADLPQGAEWTAFAIASIAHEMDVQVLPDGADYESSIPYHRLVAELFLGAARLADHQGTPFPHSYRSRVTDMVTFLASVTRPDGLMPQVGDADDGRLHILGGYGTTSPQDARHLFGPAAVMCGRPEWLDLGGEAAEWEAAWWGLRPAPARAAVAVPPVSHLFPNAGIAVVRTNSGHYLLVTNGVVGTNGFGNHKHNDLLSFEYHYGGTALVVDPGSYVYTCDPDARNRFRSTTGHNTVAIDGVEQNDLRPDWLFRLFETSNAETVAFEDRNGVIRYVGRHHGYERLPEPVTHERSFRFDASTGELTLVDLLTGRGTHRVQWRFHLAPGLDAEVITPGVVSLKASSKRWTLRVPSALRIEVGPGEYSPSYGVKVAALALTITEDIALAGAQSFEFGIAP